MRPLAVFRQQRVDPVEFGLRLRVELARRSIGIHSADLRADKMVDLVGEKPEIDRLVVIDRKQQRGPVATDARGVQRRHGATGVMR